MATPTEKAEKISKAYHRQSARAIDVLEKLLEQLYDETSKQVGIIGELNRHSVALDKAFTIQDYPAINTAVNNVLKQLGQDIGVAIVNGVRSQWTLADKKNDELCAVVFGDKLSEITKANQDRYYTNHDKALEAFIQRRRNGMNLSQRVWHYANQTKGEIESTLELGIKTGQSAAEIARDLKQYLREPDRLYRRVRDKKGELHLSEKSKTYHPGQGVYRSSYQNALRLAATENNIAYSTSDYLRVQNLDFVVGIKISLSKNHTCLGKDGLPHPFFDICDDLAGLYPKDFKFVGWHPRCRCISTTILKTDDEIIRDIDGKDRGSKNTVKDVPEQFKTWISDNEERIQRASERGTLPYFIKDNKLRVSNILGYETDEDFELFSELINKCKSIGIDITSGQLSMDSIRNAVSRNLVTEQLFAVETSKGIKYLPKRERMHRRIIEEYTGSTNVSSEYIYMLGGAPANGKSTLVDSKLLPHPEGALVIDADKVKSMIPEYAKMVSSGDKELIGAAANFVHEESSLIGKQIQFVAFKKNIATIIDGVNDGSYEKVSKRVKEIKRITGKRVRADYVSLDTDLSIKLAKMRAAKTGRMVPLPVIEKNNSEISKLIPELIKNPVFDELYLWDTNENGHPRLILKMIDEVLSIESQELYERFLAKAVN